MKDFQLSFRTKTILVLLFFGITPLLLNGLFTHFRSEKSLKEKTSQNLEEMNRLVTAQIENFIIEAFKNVEALSQNQILISPEVPLEEKSAEIKKIVSYYPIFEDITLLDISGRVLTSSSFKFYGEWENNFWFLQAKERKEIVMSDIYAAVDPTQPVLAFFVPVLDQEGKISFFLAVQINTVRLLEIISSIKIGERGQAFLINSRGDIIAHPYRSLLFEKISPTYPLKETTALKKGELDFSFRQEEVIANFRVIEKFQQYPGQNWHLILIQPKEEVLSLVKQIRNQTYVFLIFTSSVIILVASFLSRYITQPLEKLALAAKEISAGNFQVQVDIRTKDEFEDLAVTFNAMIKDLRRFYSGLEETKKTLEAQVKTRTEQLEILAKGLDEEVKRRTEELQTRINELGESRVAVMNILEDVEEARRKAEEERDKTNALITNFADGLLFFDNKDNLSMINPQGESFFEVREAEVIGRNISELSQFPRLASLAHLLGKEMRRLFREELSLGENLVLEVSTIPIGEEEEKIGTLVILHDVTREKMIERMKTEFVSLSAHQLRTPLSAVKWTLQMFLAGDLGKITRKQKEFIEKTYLANERMIKLINDLLNVARIEEGRYLYRPTPADIGIIVESVVNFYREEAKRKEIKIEFKRPKKLPKVKVDEEKIKLVITNLVDNAIEYTPKGGRVTICLKSDKKEVAFSVGDTGIGIPEDQKGRVFSKFFRGANAMRMQTEGTGLGLFITKNIIEAHKGRIWFKSKEGEGSTFYFTLPIEEKLKRSLEK